MKTPLRIRTILCPTDFSPIGNTAVPYAVLLAGLLKSKLVLLHVMTKAEQRALAVGSPLRLKAGCVDEFRRLVIETTDTYKDLVGETNVLTDFVVEEGGTPAQRVTHHAVTQKADLIVMATHGYSGFARELMGSVAERVVLDAPCPVIALRLPPTTPPDRALLHPKIQRVLVPTDLSEQSLHALPIAEAIARPFKATLTALHVIQEGVPTAATAALRQFMDMNYGGKLPVAHAVREGDPAENIVNYALHFKMDLIAMTTQGHNQIRDRLFGTTTERVMRIAPCPLLVVK
jgi:nucleotide-binding universal stress UspA family protein